MAHARKRPSGTPVGLASGSANFGGTVSTKTSLAVTSVAALLIDWHASPFDVTATSATSGAYRGGGQRREHVALLVEPIAIAPRVVGVAGGRSALLRCGKRRGRLRIEHVRQRSRNRCRIAVGGHGERIDRAALAPPTRRTRSRARARLRGRRRGENHPAAALGIPAGAEIRRGKRRGSTAPA